MKDTYTGRTQLRYYGMDMGFSVILSNGKEEYMEKELIINALLDGGFDKDIVTKTMDYLINFGRAIIDYDKHEIYAVR